MAVRKRKRAKRKSTTKKRRVRANPPKKTTRRRRSTAKRTTAKRRVKRAAPKRRAAKKVRRRVRAKGTSTIGGYRGPKPKYGRYVETYSSTTAFSPVAARANPGKKRRKARKGVRKAAGTKGVRALAKRVTRVEHNLAAHKKAVKRQFKSVSKSLHKVRVRAGLPSGR